LVTIDEMMRRVLGSLVTATVLAAACSGAGGESTTTSLESVSSTAATTSSTLGDQGTTSTAATSTTAPTTSITLPPAGLSPLNGLQVADPALIDRRVIAVKIDNHPKARPQSGLQEADAVIELLADGVTRFIALFHQSDSQYLGPVRSIRPTDSTLMAALGATLVVSGGQDWVKALTRERGVDFMEEGVEGLYRISARVPPQNLYADTTALRLDADAAGYDDSFDGPLFTFGAWDEWPTATAVTVTLDWAPGAQVRWRFVDGVYLRFAAGTEHRWVDAAGHSEQVACEVLVVIVGHEYRALPGAGFEGSGVAATDTTGSGPMAIFYGGRVIEGTWERGEITEPFLLLDTNGDPVTVPPGMLWVSIYPDSESFRWG
jgi:hypothetical protein